jgi:glycosyltransferase involved in cell wall biosynthesis
VNLVSHLPPDVLTLVGFSFRRQKEITSLFPESITYPIPPTALHYLWNKFHVLNFENFAPGKIDIYHSSDWAQAPDSSLKVTTVHDLAPLLFPKEHDRSIVDVQKSRLHWVVSECDHIICVSKNTANDLSNLFPQVQKKLTIIPEALPQRFLHKPKKSPFSDYLVAIGARQPRKNIHKLISAFIKHQKVRTFLQNS